MRCARGVTDRSHLRVFRRFGWIGIRGPDLARSRLLCRSNGSIGNVGLWELLEYNAVCFNPHRMASLLARVLEEPRWGPYLSVVNHSVAVALLLDIFGYDKTENSTNIWHL